MAWSLSVNLFIFIVEHILFLKENFYKNVVAVNFISKSMSLNVLVTLTANNIHSDGRVVVPGLNMKPYKPIDGCVG